MSNNDGFEKLRTIGAQKIHEKTHISKYHVQALLHNNFDDMTKIQFLGFVSILEREYNVHLDELRERGLEYFTSLKVTNEDRPIFMQPKQTKSNTFLYLTLAILFILIAIGYTYATTQVNKQSEITIQDNQTIKTVQEDILGIVDDINVTDTNTTDINATKNEESIIEEGELLEPIVKEEPVKELSFKIIPNARLWLGYIDLSTHKQYQTTTFKPMILDPKKDWLLNLGHADISVVVHGVVQKYNKPDNIRFLYKDQELKEITVAESRSYNKGKIW